jgi:hypothetical protein
MLISNLLMPALENAIKKVLSKKMLKKGSKTKIWRKPTKIRSLFIFLKKSNRAEESYKSRLGACVDSLMFYKFQWSMSCFHGKGGILVFTGSMFKGTVL